jgi:AAA domain
MTSARGWPPTCSGAPWHEPPPEQMTPRLQAALEAEVRGCQSATTTRGSGTLAPPADLPINTAEVGVPPTGTSGTPLGTLHRLDVGAMLTGEPEPVDWLIDAVVARGTLTLLAGREKEGKSLLSLAFAARAVVGGGTLAGIDVASASVVIVMPRTASERFTGACGHSASTSPTPGRIEVYEARGHDMPQHIADLVGDHCEPSAGPVDSRLVALAMGRR